MTATDRLIRRVRHLAVALAVLAGATAGAALPSPDATAAESCDGVWVVVDATRLGGSVRTLCAPGSPSSGLDALTRAGVAYEFVPRVPGQVCTLDGRPDPCNGAPADAYWSYWHAEAGGSWTYSQRGAGNRTPAKGSVEGWAFGAGEQPGRTPPTDAPAEPEPEPEPEPTATAEPAATPAPTVAPDEPAADDARDRQDGEAPTGVVPAPDDAPATAATQPTDAAGVDADAGGHLDGDPVVDAATEDPVDDAVAPDVAADTSDEDPTDADVPDDEVALGEVAGDGGGGAPLGAIAGGVLVVGLAGAGALRARRRGDLGEG